MAEKVIIIGAGLGGLECAYTLCKHGFSVTVLEKEPHIGGCLASFYRHDTLFDTGFHYVGGLQKGQSLYALFDFFDLLSLPFQPLDESCFDEVILQNQSFAFANGYERFASTLAQSFPHQRDNLLAYVSLLKKVGDHLPDTFAPSTGESFSQSLFGVSAYQWLQQTVADPLLRAVLSGTSLKMELSENLPLYIFAQINSSFIQSAYRLRGGGQQIAERLRERIEQMGGTVRTKAPVRLLEENGKKVSAVVLESGERLEADYVISSAHPSVTLSWLSPETSVRSIYRRRMGALPNTYGFFTANIRLKANTLPYENRNLHIHSTLDLWHPDASRTDSVLVSFGVPESGDFATTIDLLSPMPYQHFESPYSHQTDYLRLKQTKLEQCLQLVEHRLPHLRESIESVYCSTPLTYERYTASPLGSAYGVRKDYNNVLGTVLTPRTPLENLWMTGQSLNLHGILGVTMTSLLTASALLGMDTIAQDIHFKQR